MNNKNNTELITCVCDTTLENIRKGKISTCTKCKKIFHPECLFASKFELKKCPACLIAQNFPFEETENILCRIKISNIEQTNPKISKEFEVDKLLLTDLNLSTNKGIYIHLYPMMNFDSKHFKEISISINNSKIFQAPSDISLLVHENNRIEITSNTNLKIKSPLWVFVLIRKEKEFDEIKSSTLKISEYQCKIKLRKLFKNDLIARENFSVKCPYSSKTIETPVKSIYCTHFQCFDLDNFLKINKFKKSLKCPICKIECFVDEMYQDMLFLKIIRSCEEKFGEEVNDRFQIYINNQGRYYD
jgi:hypothetical protein